jgi:hypothetical protein
MVKLSLSPCISFTAVPRSPCLRLPVGQPLAGGEHDADVETSLLPGERTVWDGRPLRHRVFRPTDVLLVPFSLLWCGFAVFWDLSAMSSGAPLFFALWGVLFVLVGLYLVAGRFVVRVVSSRHTRYTITDRRVLVHGGWSGSRLRTQYLNSLPPPVITEESDGSGSLAFGGFPGVGDAFTTGLRSGWRVWSSEPSLTPILWDVPDIRRVRDLVARAQTQPGSPYHA